MSSLLNVERAKDIIVDGIAECLTLQAACEKAGVKPGNHYVWKANDAAYRAAYEYALTIRTERIEEAAELRAVQGYQEETTYYELGEDGIERATGRKTVRKYSDALLMMLLRAGNPGKFNDRVKKDEQVEDNVLETLSAARKRLAASKGETKTDGE